MSDDTVMYAAVRERSSRLDRLLDLRASKKLAVVAPQVHMALTELRRNGVDVELFGSMARGEFRTHSDVDFLINVRGHLSEVEIFAIISDALKHVTFDIVYADRLNPINLELMRLDAHRR